MCIRDRTSMVKRTNMPDIFSAVIVGNGCICTERKKMSFPVPGTKSAPPTAQCTISAVSYTHLSSARAFPLAVIYTRILLRSLGSSFRITSSFRSKLLRAVAIRAELMPIAPLISPGGMGPWWVSRYCKTKASPRMLSLIHI